MANVSKETRNGKATYRISFTDQNKKRRFIRLSKVGKKDAEVIANKVDSILSSKVAGSPLAPNVLEWLANREDYIYDKLAKVGLVQARCNLTVPLFFQNFIKTKAPDKSESWIKNHTTTLRKIEKFLPTKQLTNVTSEDACQFRKELAKRYAQATVSGDIKRIKAAFKAAVKQKLIFESPFDSVVAGKQSNDQRKFFVSRDVIERVIEKCPNAEWRLLVALTRFGGLRNPSETLALKWEHIDWVKKTIKIPGAKGKDGTPRWREIPIFEELIFPLREAYDADHEYCISKIRGSANSLRNRFVRILKKAGIAKENLWPRLWHNLRASRDTELSATLPAHEVAALMGNSPKVSNEHYKMMSPEHFESLKHTADKSGTIVAQQPPIMQESDGNESQQIPEIPEEIEKPPANAEALVHLRGFEPLTFGSVDRCSIQLSYRCGAIVKHNHSVPIIYRYQPLS
jgi:integrase